MNIEYKISKFLNEDTKTDDNVNVLIDVALTGKLLDNFLKKAKNYGLIAVIDDPEGPGGSWPSVEISGPKNKLKLFLKDNWDSNVTDADIEDYII